MIHYLIQLLLFQALFLGVYELFLKKETFFSLNRIYLLATPFLAAFIPFLEIEILRTVVPTSEIVQLPVLFISENSPEISTALDPTYRSDILGVIPSGVEGWLFIVYLLGAIISFAVFLRKYLQLRSLKNSGKLEKFGKTKLVHISESRIACSFFNSIFLGEDLSEEETKQILAHELAHVEQKHSWDLLWFEILRIVLWFNPFIYRQQAQLSMLHEYIADEKAVQNFERKSYFQDLLNATFGTRQISFTNQFFTQSFIKKRILMLQKPKSNRNAKLKYLLVLPLMFAMLSYVSCSEDQNLRESTNSNIKTFEVESMEFLNENQQNKIQNAIQNIGSQYEKVIVEDIENQLNYIYTDISFADNFITEFKDKTGKTVIANTIVYKNSKYSKDGKEFTINSPKYGVIVEYTKNGIELLPPPPPSPPSPFDGSGIPMAALDQVPVFPGCENLEGNEAIKTCMANKIAGLINTNFDTGLAEKLGLTGTQRIQVIFKIDKTGEVVDVKAKAPQPELEEEAVRVVRMLPLMEPGKQDGKMVDVLYSLPIVFQVKDDKNETAERHAEMDNLKRKRQTKLNAHERERSSLLAIRETKLNARRDALLLQRENLKNRRDSIQQLRINNAKGK